MITAAPRPDPIIAEVARLLAGRTPEELLMVRAAIKALLDHGIQSEKDPGIQALLRGWCDKTEAERKVIAGKVVMAIANLSQPAAQNGQSLN